MADELKNFEKTVEQSMENARGAIDRFSEVFQKTMGMNPWTGTAFVDQMQSLAEKNIRSALEFVSKLSKAKSLPEVMQIQTEFMQSQFSALGEQTRTLGEAYARSAADAVNKVSKAP